MAQRPLAEPFSCAAHALIPPSAGFLPQIPIAVRYHVGCSQPPNRPRPSLIIDVCSVIMLLNAPPHSPALLNNGKPGSFGLLLNGYALGWPTVGRDEHPAVAPVGGGRSALFIYPKDDLAIIVLSNLMASNPEQFIDEIGGFYYPEMKVAAGFGLPANLRKLRAALLVQGFDKAIPVATKLRKKDPGFQLKESELNGWGYQLLSQKNARAALAIFRLNVSLHPKSGNVYDSLAEVFEMMGEKEEALLHYKKSLQLDPGNRNAAKRIAALSQP